MGFLGGDNNDDRGSQLLDEQLSLNKAELEAKRQSLFQTRLDIIKGQGAESWTPDYNKRAPIPKDAGRPPEIGFGGHKFNFPTV